jgi:hypothetical protein
VQLLRHLVRDSRTARVLLLGSYRAEDVGAGHPLHDLLVGTGPAGRVTRIDLGPLDLADVAELVTARTPGAPPDSVADFARRLRDESGGSPFFVCELLEHLDATGDLERLLAHAGATALPVPDSVREVVVQRLAQVAPGTGDLLATAALIGLSFDLELLATLAERPPEDVLCDLETVERVGIVVEVDAGRFAFAHAIVRSTLVDGMSASRRALGHRRIAEAIESLGRADHDELAHHWSLAGVDGKAFASLELAARRDLDALAYESAAERYEAIVEHERRARTGDTAAMARALLGRGLAQRALGRPEYLVAVEEAGRLGRRLRDVDVVVEAAVASTWPGTFFLTAGRIRTSLVELCEDALLLVDEDDPRRMRILATLAAHLTFDPDRARRVELLRGALDGARQIGDPELIGSALVAEFLSLWDPSTVDRRAQIAGEVARMARASGSGDLDFYGGFFAAIGAAERCDVAAAVAALDGLAERVASSRNFYFGFLTDRLRASIAILCDEEDAQARIDAVAQRYAGTHADTTGTWALQVGGLALQRGTLGDLAPALRSMVEESEVGSNWSAAYGLALLAAGDAAAAGDVLDRFVEPPFDYFWLTTMQVVAQLAVGLDRRDEAGRCYGRLLPYREQLGITASGSLCFGLVATSLGELALALDEPATAVDLLESAVALADEMAAPFEAVRARRLLADARRRTGADAAVVDALVDDAAAMARAHGFAAELRLLDAVAGGERAR